MKALIAALALSACAAPAIDQGGSIDQYARSAKFYHRELPKDCQSACTMYLLNGCITPDHVLRFHSPRHILAGVIMVPMQPEPFKIATQRIAQHYPPAIRDLYLDELRHSYDFISITGQDLIDLGARQCG